jgi:hypothetical protein
MGLKREEIEQLFRSELLRRLDSSRQADGVEPNADVLYDELVRDLGYVLAATSPAVDEVEEQLRRQDQ